MLPGDYLLCNFPRSHEEGERFRSWPLHVTLVPWFRLKLSEDEFADKLKATIAQSSFTATVGAQAKFGHRKVNLLDKPTWQSLHEAVYRQVKLHAVNTAPLRFVGERFTPHITHQEEGHYNMGDQFVCDAIYLIKQLGLQKEVSAKIGLSND